MYVFFFPNYQILTVYKIVYISYLKSHDKSIQIRHFTKGSTLDVK